jgi:hypothetical protein
MKTKNWKRCPCCSTPFIPNPWRSIGFYCSSLCAIVHSSPAPEGKCWRRCRHCKQEFLAVHPHMKFCSEVCRDLEIEQQRTARAQKVAQGQVVVGAGVDP